MTAVSHSLESVPGVDVSSILDSITNLPKGNRVGSAARDILLTAPDWRAIDSLTQVNLTYLKDITSSQNSAIVTSIREGMLAGEGIPDMVARITKTAQIPKTRAVKIARTEVIRACDSGCRTRYDQYGVERVKWVSAHDARVCAICAALDGQEFALKDAPSIPVHPYCRCTLIPVIPKRKK